MPVYFISEVLSPTKQRYPHYQKLAYSVFTTVRKLRQYFTVHPIIVVNEAPLSNILNNPLATGHVSLWGIELSPMDIDHSGIVGFFIVLSTGINTNETVS
jgi:hypothetical protein